MVDHENLVTISCFRTFLISFNPTSSIFAFILNAFFFTCFYPFFHKNFLQVYIQEAGEGTSPILSFLHPFVMIWNKKLSAESDI